jgi:hypothetical protein
MKTKLLLLTFLIVSFHLSAQLNVWTGTVGDKWSDEDNWSGTVPTASDDVLIPSGFTVTLDTPANILSIEVQGNSVLNVTEGLTIANPSEFEDNVTVNWISGDLLGGGILLNSGTINLSFNSFDISGSTVLNNPGTINLLGVATIIIGTDSVLNNSGTGVIDFQSNSTEITKSGAAPNVLNNFGTIKTTFPNPTDQGAIGSQLINTDGIIQVESGTLNLSNTAVNLMSGTYNVSAGASLNLNSPTTISGTLTGNVIGNLNWNADMIVSSTAVFDFQGNNIINWLSGDIEGGGTLTNLSIINRSNSSNVFIRDASILENEGEIHLNGTGDIFITTNGIINNNTNGVIDFLFDGSGISFSGSAPNVLNNMGVIKGNLPSGSALINVQVNNSGSIEAISNTLNFLDVLNNESSGVLKGTGIIDLPTPVNFINNGTVAPGNSPGVLTIIGNYSTTASTILNIELNGLTQGSEYDLLAINGNADFDGDVQITLGFSPNINDEFIVATTTGTINSCNLPATTTSSFGGFNYEFDVACRNNDEVVLTVTNETLDVNSFEDNSKPIVLYPNPAKDIIKFSSNTIKKIEVYDIAGKLLIDSQTNSISTQLLPSGLYLVKGTGLNNASVIKKLIKQ